VSVAQHVGFRHRGRNITSWWATRPGSPDRVQAQARSPLPAAAARQPFSCSSTWGALKLLPISPINWRS